MSSKIKHKFVFLTIFYWSYNQTAFGYVDPGIVGSLYQMLYVLVFGVIAAWVLKPWKWLKHMFQKLIRGEAIQDDETGEK